MEGINPWFSHFSRNENSVALVTSDANRNLGILQKSLVSLGQNSREVFLAETSCPFGANERHADRPILRHGEVAGNIVVSDHADVQLIVEANDVVPLRVEGPTFRSQAQVLTIKMTGAAAAEEQEDEPENRRQT